jgi:hypothetical protein
MINVYFQSRHAVFSYKKKFSSHAWVFGPPMNYATLVGRASVPAASRVKWCVKRTLQKLIFA